MKKNNFNIIYFLAVFFILNYGFYFYVGLSTPGGKMYSGFLHSWLNIPYWLSAVVAKASTVLLNILGYSAYQRNAANITLEGGRSVTIAWGCIGIGVMIVWLAFIAAHKEKILYKLKWIIAGILLIYIVNTLRIVFIILSYYYHWTYFQSFNAHQTFNILSYVIIILLMFVFAWCYNHRRLPISLPKQI